MYLQSAIHNAIVSGMFTVTNCRGHLQARHRQRKEGEFKWIVSLLHIVCVAMQLLCGGVFNNYFFPIVWRVCK